MNLPEYQCHKKVRALKIGNVIIKHHDNDHFAQITGATIVPADSTIPSFEVPGDYVKKHNPQSGGYYVLYEDGYSSYSPAKAFEDGYTKIASGGSQIARADAIVEIPHGTAPRITKEDIEAEIAREYYFTAANGVDGADVAALREQTPNEGTSWVPQSEDPDLLTTDLGPLTLLTFCVLVMRNHFTVVGKSACASPENFNAELGRKYARENAIEEVWPLMGYELRSKLSDPRYQLFAAANKHASVTSGPHEPPRPVGSNPVA